MIKERMLELLLMERYSNFVGFDGKKINKKEYFKRLKELREEFLNPYVIDSTSKEL